ncbi:hypothetical protein MIND_01036100 [Mycena indigotica]|uniref:Ribosome biogenesis protein NSA1 n=1 Tax=Mycena indigotica TaxID=2126181 RepID=A0A8H6S8K0_9AGAR|nr:uncharacterized protein MIND_01036100 [Mycena indigotica]KAF7294980.1 hypothetical protein MIND_01036100 [Mycena indigotica]
MFLVGDELGHLKALHINASGTPSELVQLDSDSTPSSVAAISVRESKVAVAFASGLVTRYTWDRDKELAQTSSWKETRLRPQETFVGLQQSERGIYSCTSNGALRLVTDDGETSLGSLPARLCVWRHDPASQTFSYGGNEVDVSVWDSKAAFASTDASVSSSKRKRNDLFPGETWRSKNVQTDNLGLRQPIRITTLNYLPSASSPQLLAGTQLGDLRRYDTRAARRPISQWAGIAKTGGVKVLEKGLADHEVLVGDHGCNLSSVDLRNGRIVYSYKGLSGAITSVAPSSLSHSDGRGAHLLVSTALDRYCRIHTTFPPPAVAGSNQDNSSKGQVIEKIFTTSVPTVVAWDGVHQTPVQPPDEDDDVWDEMENIGSDDESDRRKRRRTENK